MEACTAEQMREIDRRAVAEYGIPSLLLMENAGRAVAQRALSLLEAGRGPVVVLCGKGNNGGDGFVAARHLWNRGLPVRCFLAGAREEVRGDARVMLDLLGPLGLPVEPFGEDTALPGAALVVDALLGTGFRGTPLGAIGAAIRAANASGAPVLAVDVPSGLDADTGRPAEPCVRAAETVTFGLPKLGLIQYPGRELAGRLTVAEISLPRPLLESLAPPVEWTGPGRAAPLWPARSRGAHKGDAGRLFVLAGSPGMTGAAVLACEASLRAGAGLVTLGIAASLNPILEVKLTEAMTLPLPETGGGHPGLAAADTVLEWAARSDAVAVGPGLGRGPETAELLRTLVAGCRAPLVVDADGLNLLAPAGPGTFPPHAVLTPHPGEMARLLGTDVAGVESNRVATAREAAARFGCVVLLKGASTVVAAPDGRTAVNSSGSAALATGGSGDVLTGVLGACLARRLQPFEAALSAAYLHGAAGEVAGARCGAPGAVAGDVVAAIPEALRRLRAGELAEPYERL